MKVMNYNPVKKASLAKAFKIIFTQNELFCLYTPFGRCAPFSGLAGLRAQGIVGYRLMIFSMPVLMGNQKIIGEENDVWKTMGNSYGATCHNRVFTGKRCVCGR